MNKDLKRMIIQSHVTSKTNVVTSQPEGYIKVTPPSEVTCTDKWDIYLKINNDIIQDMKYSGSGCAISTSSLSILSSLLVGKNFKEANEILDNYYKMIKGESFDELLLKELVVFENVHTVWNRVECSLVGYKALKSVVGGKHE